MAATKFHDKIREREGSGAVFVYQRFGSVLILIIWNHSFLIIITGIIRGYLIKLMKSLLAPDLEQVFHVLPFGRQYLCLAPGSMAASWTVGVIKCCWDSPCSPASALAGVFSLTSYIHCLWMQEGHCRGNGTTVGKNLLLNQPCKGCLASWLLPKTWLVSS